MSTISSSLPAGLTALSNAGLLPSNLTTQQLQQASPAELTQNAIDNVEETTISALFGDTASASDTASLSSELTNSLFGTSTASGSSTTDPILQALDSALPTSGTSATNATTASALTDSNDAGVGTLFSYMG